MNFSLQPLAIAASCVTSIAELAQAPRVRNGDKFATPKGWRWAFRELIGVMHPSRTGPLTDQLLRDESNSNVDGVILFVNSPGGTVAGTPELAEAVGRVAASKPIHVVAEEYLASGAMWVASQATTITASPSTLCGSVGVIHVLVDESDYFKQLGVKVIAVASSGIKSLGLPGVEVTEDHVEYIRRLVDYTTANFELAICKGRKLTKEQLARVSTAEVWYAAAAKHKGLIDDVAIFSDAMSKFVSTHPPEQYAELSGRNALNQYLALVNAELPSDENSGYLGLLPGSVQQRVASKYPTLAAAAHDFYKTSSYEPSHRRYRCG